ncbi:bifunctional 2',3'-cyclic-nucleotide 2'-phosphodiesterase/3'-nucleotidase [Serratia sp. DD3]|uniref:bifunctional 2',3'-cyclic-nucleotide 2'-phosphodiesterase/3'-nucleotidase n=1 Tax=Serratia sp. DD3 TaxID=1410619 RepID=UPI0003C4E6E0|nr:bifunctional 2',3'-cyclic-nucleotide 2'-phosphodiesterase/3'-nucleotidase [Serratia sp. DD3]KEY60851.1 trifunctional nucleotide phosphoesterase protein YfkN [Serratia sp. DD3]
MLLNFKKNIISLSLLSVSVLALNACDSSDNHEDTAAAPAIGSGELTLAATTDLHANILSYDYFKLSEDKSFGFERTATLLREIKSKYSNVVLLDNGDTIQGTALADYQAQVNPISCNEKLAIYQAMDEIGYDAATLGNHEFNYGLPYLAQVTGTTFNIAALPAVSEQKKCVGPNFPLVSSNVWSQKDGKPLYKPYIILNKSVKIYDEQGQESQLPIKIAVIGFTPPPIMNWDKRWLDGQIGVSGVVEAAEKYVPMAKAEGADLVIALSHGGYSTGAYSAEMENANYYLAKVPGIDAIIMGHSHNEFPLASCSSRDCTAPGVDSQNGFLNGVPAVMASYWGKAVGLIHLTLQHDQSGWKVVKENTRVELDKTLLDAATKTYVDSDPSISQAIQIVNEEVIDYVKTPIGRSDFDMTTYFADVGEVSAIQIVNAAQADYVKAYVDLNLPEYSDIPVLSVSAPFKGGFSGVGDFTVVKAGELSIYNAADLYLYPNTVYAVLVTGDIVKGWLEKSAERFNQIDPAVEVAQNLTASFPSFNFDMFTSDDLKYQIDITQPVGKRIVELTYKGKTIDASQQFIIATNNYRATGGGGFPGLTADRIIYASPDNNRDVLINYIKNRAILARVQDGNARSWRFVPVSTAGPVIFRSAADKLAYAQSIGLINISIYKADDGNGMSLYQIDLSN